MARIRTVKPEFWSDERVGECSPTARLLFIGMWNFADDHGGIERSAKQLKAQVFPYDATDCEPLLQELMRVGLLIEYEAGGRKYLYINGFRKHQKVEKPARPRGPLYEDSPTPPRGLTDSSPTSNGSSLGREGKGREEEAPAEPATPPRKTSRARKPQTTLPADFELDSELREYAESKLPQVDAVALFEGFCGKARAKSWVYADWRQAWQEFCRNAAPNSGHWSSGQYPQKGQAKRTGAPGGHLPFANL